MPAKRPTPNHTLFDLLSALQTKNPGFFHALPANQQATFSPYVLMRWLASASDDQLLLLNDYANKYAFALAEHKGLLIDTLSACCSGFKARHHWAKRPSNGTKSQNKLHAMLCEYYGPLTDVEAAVARLNAKQLRDIGEQLGYDDAEIERVLSDAAC